MTENNTALTTPNAPGTLAPRPTYIKQGGREGLETMSKDDLMIPRLALAQALSPQVTEGDPNRIEGLTPGDLFNSITGQKYGREVFVQIIRKDKLRAMEFYSIDDGGGVKDPNVPLDDDRLKWGNSGNKQADKPRATLFRDYLARLLPSGELIALSFKSSGIKVAKTLNGLIAMRDANIYEGRYRITTDTELQPKPHKVFRVENADWCSEAEVGEGRRMWAALKDFDMAARIDRDGTTREPGDEEFDTASMEGGQPTDM